MRSNKKKLFKVLYLRYYNYYVKNMDESKFLDNCFTKYLELNITFQHQNFYSKIKRFEEHLKISYN